MTILITNIAEPSKVSEKSKEEEISSTEEVVTKTLPSSKNHSVSAAASMAKRSANNTPTKKYETNKTLPSRGVAVSSSDSSDRYVVPILWTFAVVDPDGKVRSSCCIVPSPPKRKTRKQ